MAYSILDAFLSLKDISDESVEGMLVSKPITEAKSTDIRDDRKLKELYAELDAEKTNSDNDEIEIIDADADSLNHIKEKKDYVGQAVLTCKKCRAKTFIDPDKLEVAEDDPDTYNKELECPYCHGEGDGFEVVGQVAAFDKAEEEAPAEETSEEETPAENEEGEADENEEAAVENDEKNPEEITFDNDESTEEEPAEEPEEEAEEESDEGEENEFDDYKAVDEPEDDMMFTDTADPDSEDVGLDIPEPIKEEELEAEKSGDKDINININVKGVDDEKAKKESLYENGPDACADLKVSDVANVLVDSAVTLIDNRGREVQFIDSESLPRVIKNMSVVKLTTFGSPVSISLDSQIEGNLPVACILSKMDQREQDCCIFDVEDSDYDIDPTESDFTVSTMSAPGDKGIGMYVDGDLKIFIPSYVDDEIESDVIDSEYGGIDEEDELVDEIIDKNGMNKFRIVKPMSREYQIDDSIRTKKNLKSVYESYIKNLDDKNLIRKFSRVTGYQIDEAFITESKKKKKLTLTLPAEEKECKGKKCKDRKEVAEAIEYIKNRNNTFRVSRSLDENYRYVVEEFEKNKLISAKDNTPVENNKRPYIDGVTEDVLRGITRISADIKDAIDNKFGLNISQRDIVADICSDLMLVRNPELADNFGEFEQEGLAAFNDITDFVGMLIGDPEFANTSEKKFKLALNMLHSPSFSTEAIQQGIGSEAFIEQVNQGAIPYLTAEMIDNGHLLEGKGGLKRKLKNVCCEDIPEEDIEDDIEDDDDISPEEYYETSKQYADSIKDMSLEEAQDIWDDYNFEEVSPEDESEQLIYDALVARLQLTEACKCKDGKCECDEKKVCPKCGKEICECNQVIECNEGCKCEEALTPFQLYTKYIKNKASNTEEFKDNRTDAVEPITEDADDEYYAEAVAFADSVKDMTDEEAQKWWDEYEFDEFEPDDDAEKLIYNTLQAKLGKKLTNEAFDDTDDVYGEVAGAFKAVADSTRKAQGVGESLEDDEISHEEYVEAAREYADQIADMSAEEAEKIWDDFDFDKLPPEDEAEEAIYNALKTKLGIINEAFEDPDEDEFTEDEEGYGLEAKAFADSVKHMSKREAQKWWEAYEFDNRGPDNEGEQAIFDALQAKLNECINEDDTSYRKEIERLAQKQRSESVVSEIEEQISEALKKKKLDFVAERAETKDDKVVLEGVLDNGKKELPVTFTALKSSEVNESVGKTMYKVSNNISKEIFEVRI